MPRRMSLYQLPHHGRLGEESNGCYTALDGTLLYQRSLQRFAQSSVEALKVDHIQHCPFTMFTAATSTSAIIIIITIIMSSLISVGSASYSQKAIESTGHLCTACIVNLAESIIILAADQQQLRYAFS
jgi:hypothetical protein